MPFFHGQGSGGPLQGLPKPPTAPPGAPAYADIWNYTPFSYRTDYTANTQIRPDQSQNPYTFSGGKERMETVGGGEGGSYEQAVRSPISMQINMDKIPEKYRGLVSGMEDGGGSRETFKYDMSKLPNKGMTKFGIDVLGTTSLGTGSQPDWNKVPGHYKVANKNMAYFDPNFGWITPTKNLLSKEDARDEKQMAAMQAAASFAFPFAAVPGAAGIPGLAMSGIGAAKTFGDSGNWKAALMNILPGLIGAGMSSGGFSMPKLPPELAQALKYAQYAKQGYGMYQGLKGR